MTLWNRTKHWPVQGPVELEGHIAPLAVLKALQTALERLSEALSDSSHSIHPALDEVWEAEDNLTAELVEKHT